MKLWTEKEVAIELRISAKTAQRWLASIGARPGGCQHGPRLYRDADFQRLLGSVERREVFILKADAAPSVVPLKKRVSKAGGGAGRGEKGGKSVRSKGPKTGLKVRKPVAQRKHVCVV